MKYVLPNRLTTEDKEEFKLHWKKAHDDMMAIIENFNLKPEEAFEMAASLWPPMLLGDPPDYAMSDEYLNMKGKLHEITRRKLDLQRERESLEPGSPRRDPISREIGLLRADEAEAWRMLRSMSPESQE